MPQFDVHRNKGSQRESIPYVVVIQSARFDDYRRRVVAPLVRLSAVPGGASSSGSRMNPIFRIEEVEVVLNPLQVVSVALDQLGTAIGSLAEHGQQITDAMDELLTRAWG